MRVSSRFVSGALVLTLFLLVGQGCTPFGKKTDTKAGPVGTYVGTDSGGDKGIVWKQFSTEPTGSGVRTLGTVSVFRYVDDPQDPKTFYWLTRADGLYFTTDEGQTWRHAGAPLATGLVYDAAVDSKNSCVVYATNGEQIYKTEDCARTWTEVYREVRATARVNSVATDPFLEDTVYAATERGDIIKSTDRGETWQVIYRANKAIGLIRTDMMKEGVIYAASKKNGLYRSDDGGDNWINIKEALSEYPKALDERRFVVHPKRTGLIYWVSTYGILVSADYGETWRPMNLITPSGSAQIYGFDVNVHNENIVYYTATINNRSAFYKSTDGGETWETAKLPSGQLPTVIRSHPDKSRQNIIYLGFSELPKQK